METEKTRAVFLWDRQIQSKIYRRKKIEKLVKGEQWEKVVFLENRKILSKIYEGKNVKKVWIR